jgi:hypothetical protein
MIMNIVWLAHQVIVLIRCNSPEHWLLSNILSNNNKISSSFLFLLLFGRGFIVAFANVLTIYLLYYTWIHPSIILLYSTIPGTVSTDIISTVFALYSHFFSEEKVSRSLKVYKKVTKIRIDCIADLNSSNLN